MQAPARTCLVLLLGSALTACCDSYGSIEDLPVCRVIETDPWFQVEGDAGAQLREFRRLYGDWGAYVQATCTSSREGARVVIGCDGWSLAGAWTRTDVPFPFDQGQEVVVAVAAGDLEDGLLLFDLDGALRFVYALDFYLIVEDAVLDLSASATCRYADEGAPVALARCSNAYAEAVQGAVGGAAFSLPEPGSEGASADGRFEAQLVSAWFVPCSACEAGLSERQLQLLRIQ